MSKNSTPCRLSVNKVVPLLRQAELLESPAGIWVGPFVAAVNAGAETAFYKELAGFTERFVRIEASLQNFN